MGVRGVLKIFAIVLVTVTATFLCFRFGNSMSEIPISTVIVNHTVGGDREVHDFENVLNIVGNEPITVSGTHESTDRQRDEVRPDDLDYSGSTGTEQLSKNLSGIMDYIQAKNESLNAVGKVHDHLGVHGPSNVSPIALRDDTLKKNWYPTDHYANEKSVNINHEGDNKSVYIGKYQNMNRQSNQDDYSNTVTDKRTAEKSDRSAGHDDNVYDFIYGTVDYGGYKQADDVVGGIELNRNHKNSKIHASSVYERYYEPRIAHHEHSTNYQLLRRPGTKYIRPCPQNKVEISKKSSIDWKIIGKLLLVKFGLVKLKTFGALMVVFLILFKMKLFLMTIYYKYVLLLKLTKFLKSLTFPLLLISLLPILSTLLSPMASIVIYSILRRILDMPSRPSSTSTSTPSTTPPSILGGFLPSQASILPPNRPTRPSGMVYPSKGIFDKILPYDIPDIQGTLEGDNMSSPSRRHYDTLNTLDPTSNIYRKILDSEKCVERIACRIAVVENTVITPSWINWLLHSISKIIPNKNLESYLKTYEDVIDAILTNSHPTDSWKTWCIERYKCNDTYATNTNDTRFF